MTTNNKNSILKNIFSMIDVAVIGFLLLNVTFLFDYLFQGTIKWIISLFSPVDVFRDYSWFPGVMHGLFILLIAYISWLIFKSKLADLYKAIYMTVPLTVVYVTIGIFFYRWPVAAYSLGGLFSLGIFSYLYRTRQPWIYYYTLILVGLTLLISVIFGVEI